MLHRRRRVSKHFFSVGWMDCYGGGKKRCATHHRCLVRTHVSDVAGGEKGSVDVWQRTDGCGVGGLRKSATAMGVSVLALRRRGFKGYGSGKANNNKHGSEEEEFWGVTVDITRGGFSGLGC